MHGIIEEWKINDFRFIWGYDTGMNVGCKSIIDVEYKGAYLFSRYFYFSEANESHIKNFAKKVAGDEEYKRQIVKKEAEWQKVNEVYENIANVLYGLWSNNMPDFNGYIASDKKAKKNFEKLQDRFYSLCDSLYDYISNNIGTLWTGWKESRAETIAFLITQVENRKAQSKRPAAINAPI